MQYMYIVSETMGAIILLILLYANIFELKKNTKKRIIFTHLLIVNEIVIVADVVSWLELDWVRLPVLLTTLLTITFIVPFVMLGLFSRYLYEHISEKSETSRRPFAIMECCSAAVGTVCFLLCICQKMFLVQERVVYSGTFQILYYVFYILSLIYFTGVILYHRKTLGVHDLIGAISFCLAPMISIVISMFPSGINLAIPFMAINMLIIFVLLQSESETQLLTQSNTDELTGLYNRRAYVEDLATAQELPLEPDFVYASIDINGLKQVNDNLGHTAGDELINGVAYCLKRTFGNYGKIYRTGGDEFIALIQADEKQLRLVLEDLKNLSEEWCGTQVKRLAFSVGYAEKREFPDNSIKALSDTAEKRMYKEKEHYYAQAGVDRRGQNEAHKVLCSLYTKILKVDLTLDKVTIINMPPEERMAERGYSERISQWLKEFGTRGYVHPEDLEMYLEQTDMDYMRDYFRQGKESLSVIYRRKYEDGFKRVLMEMIPTKDYTDEHQSLFLYVKNIEV